MFLEFFKTTSQTLGDVFVHSPDDQSVPILTGIVRSAFQRSRDPCPLGAVDVVETKNEGVFVGAPVSIVDAGR
jgi:hypothetical protein